MKIRSYLGSIIEALYSSRDVGEDILMPRWGYPISYFQVLTAEAESVPKADELLKRKKKRFTWRRMDPLHGLA